MNTLFTANKITEIQLKKNQAVGIVGLLTAQLGNQTLINNVYGECPAIIIPMQTGMKQRRKMTFALAPDDYYRTTFMSGDDILIIIRNDMVAFLTFIISELAFPSDRKIKLSAFEFTVSPD